MRSAPFRHGRHRPRLAELACTLATGQFGEPSQKRSLKLTNSPGCLWSAGAPMREMPAPRTAPSRLEETAAPLPPLPPELPDVPLGPGPPLEPPPSEPPSLPEPPEPLLTWLASTLDGLAPTPPLGLGPGPPPPLVPPPPLGPGPPPLVPLPPLPPLGPGPPAAEATVPND